MRDECTCPMDDWYQKLCDYCLAEDASELRVATTRITLAEANEELQRNNELIESVLKSLSVLEQTQTILRSIADLLLADGYQVYQITQQKEQ